MATSHPTTIDLEKYIDSNFYGQRPHIRGRRVLVSTIAANAYDNDWSVATVARKHGLSKEEVLAALLYYYEHQDEIDAQDAEQRQHNGMPRSLA